MGNTVFGVLGDFNTYFRTNRLPYCIVGRTEQLGPHMEGDIDIIIRQSDVGGLHAKVSEFCGLHGLLPVQCVQHEHNAFCYVIAWSANGNPEFLRLDFCGDYHKRGRLFLRAEELLSGRVETGVEGNRELKLFVASPPVGFVYYLVKKIDRGMIDDAQGFYLHNQWKKDPAGCAHNVSRFWNESERSLIARACETNNWLPVRNAIPKLRGSLHRTVPVSWRGAWGELSLRVRRALRPTGLVVAFLGGDGAVKSSVPGMVQTRIAPAFSRCARYDLRPGFPGVHTQDGAKRAGTAPKSWGEHRAIFAAVKLTCCWLYSTSRYLVAARWKKVYSTLVLFDQYYADMFAEKTFDRCVPLSIVSFAGKCIPKPDLFVAMIALPDAGRKIGNDMYYENDIDNTYTYLYLLKGMKNVCYIDAGQPVDNMSQNAVKGILEYMTLRTSKQLKNNDLMAIKPATGTKTGRIDG